MPLSRADLEELVRSDPTDPMTHGRAAAWLRHKDPTPEERQVLERILRAPQRQPVAAAPRHPAEPRRVPRGAERKGLTPVDVAWIQRLPTDPAAIADDDAAHLSRLEAEATNESERRLVRQSLDPVRAHHERRIERAQIEARLAVPDPAPFRDRETREAIEAALAPKIRDKDDGGTPELTENEALNRAHTFVRGTWTAADLARKDQQAADRARLAELNRG